MDVFGVATAADLLRLLLLPPLAWAAYRDIRTRRVSSGLWYPLLAIGVLALALDAAAAFPFDGYAGRIFLVRVGFALLFVIPFSVLAYRLAAFGGADMKALVVLAVAFPTTPAYVVPLWILPDVTWLHTVGFPVHPAALGVTAMSALTNAVLFGAGYIALLFASNLAAGRLSPAMFVGRWTAVDDLPTVHGQLLRVDGLRPERGLDLDALRMYLRWRGTTLAAVRADPEAHRDPASVEGTHPRPTAPSTTARGPTAASTAARTTPAASSSPTRTRRRNRVPRPMPRLRPPRPRRRTTRGPPSGSSTTSRGARTAPPPSDSAKGWSG